MLLLFQSCGSRCPECYLDSIRAKTRRVCVAHLLTGICSLFFYPAAALAWTLHKRECAAKERNEQRFYEFDLEDDAEDVELLSRDSLKHHRLTETEA